VSGGFLNPQKDTRHLAASALDAVAGWRFFKPAVFLACLLPGAQLAFQLYSVLSGRDPSALGPDPTKLLEHETGRLALNILLITLSITPIRRLLHANRIQSIRRMLGVWSFVYALIHLFLYLTLDQLCYSWETCQLPTIWEDLTRRPFIFVGMVAFSILLVLAITSTNGWMRRLKRNWQRLHRLVYVAAAAAIVHFAWGQKADISEPLWWAGYLVLLLGLRVMFALQKRRSPLIPAVSR
jgi:methionine sulfoxide reductase heme-binding subunit